MFDVGEGWGHAGEIGADPGALDLWRENAITRGVPQCTDPECYHNMPTPPIDDGEPF